MNDLASPTTTSGGGGGGGGGGDTTVTTSRPAAAGGRPRGGGGGGGGGAGGDKDKNNKATGAAVCNPVITALAASSALSLQVTATWLCHSFITVQAQAGEILAIVPTSLQEAKTVAHMGLFSIGDFYALSAYAAADNSGDDSNGDSINGDTDFMWKLARVFGAVSLALGGMATLTAWAIAVPCCYGGSWSSLAAGASPSKKLGGSSNTGTMIWVGIAACGAMAALLQVPTFLILEAYPCTDFMQQQSCHLAVGSYLTMASVVAWIVVTALTQLLDPPVEWAARSNLEHWRVVPKNNTAGGESTQQEEEDNVGEGESTSTCEGEDDHIFIQVEEGEISAIHDDMDDNDDDEDDDDDGSQDPIFSPRPRVEATGRGICFVSSSGAASISSSTSSFWDRFFGSGGGVGGSSSSKAWQRCVNKSSLLSSSKSKTTSKHREPQRVVQRFSYASAALNNSSNNRHSQVPSTRGRLLHQVPPLNSGGDLRESSLLVEEAVNSSYNDESTITFESATDGRRRGRQQQQHSNTTAKAATTNWAGLVQASSMAGHQQPQTRGCWAEEDDPVLQHVVELEGLRRYQQQAAPPPPQDGQHCPIQVLHGGSAWDKPGEGIVPADETLTASSLGGRDSPITGDESILDKIDNTDTNKQQHDDSSSSSSDQSSSAISSQDEEQVKAVAVSGVPIYEDLLAEDETKKKQNIMNFGEDAGDEHDNDLEEKKNNDTTNPLSSSSVGGGGGDPMEDPFFSELPDASAILHNTSSSGGGGYNFLDITSNTNLTNKTVNTTTTASRFRGGVGLLSGVAAGFRSTRVAGTYYPFENDYDDDDDEDYELNNSQGPPIAEVQIYSVEPAAAGGAGTAGVGSLLDDSILDSIHPVSSSSEQELLQTWKDLFDFDDDPNHTTLEDYRLESLVTSFEENASSIDQHDDRLKSRSAENKVDVRDVVDDDGRQQQHQQRPVRGKAMEHDADRTGGETPDSPPNINDNDARELKRRQVIAAVVRRTNGGSGGGVTLRPRRQHRRSRHSSDSVSSATSLLSFTIEEETAKDLIEEVGSGDLDGGDDHHYDHDKEIVERARQVKESIPLCRTQSLPYPVTKASVISQGESDITRPQHHHRATSLPMGEFLLDAEEDRGHVIPSLDDDDKNLKQGQQQNDEDHIAVEYDPRYQPVSLHRPRSQSLEVDRKKSKRRTASRSLSPDCSVESPTPKSNKSMWRTDREARSSIHNLPVITLSESSDDDDHAAVARGSLTTSNKIASSSPNRARQARIQRLQREREQQQQQQQLLQQQPKDPPLTPTAMMGDTTDASSDAVDDTTIETAEPVSRAQEKLLHCALTPPRRGVSSASLGSSRSSGGAGGLDEDSVASSRADGNDSSYLLDTLEVSLAQLQREDEMEYGPDENSI